MMKSLTSTAALLLLLTVYCTAMPRAVNELAPGSCCFKFFTGRVPPQKIVSIIKTHSSCQENGYVIGTASGNEVCVSQNQAWAQKVYKQQQTIEE